MASFLFDVHYSVPEKTYQWQRPGGKFVVVKAVAPAGTQPKEILFLLRGTPLMGVARGACVRACQSGREAAVWPQASGSKGIGPGDERGCFSAA